MTRFWACLKWGADDDGAGDYSFSTQAELEAFLYGASEAIRWREATVAALSHPVKRSKLGELAFDLKVEK